MYPKTILNSYSFIDDDDDTSINELDNYKNHPIYKKYYKMLSCGVP